MGLQHITSGTMNPAHGAQTAVEQSRSTTEVQAAVIMARQFPRDQIQATERIRVACQREGLARAAVYTYARGGSNVSGPSIRLAESMAQAWGNLQYGIRELSNNGKESTVEAYCWDMETNVRVAKTFQVPHIRKTKTSTRTLDDPRDIYENVANNGARRLRACILGVIPGDVVEMAVDECEQTMKNTVQLTEKKVQKLVEAFMKHGITQAMIEERLQRKVQAMTPGQYLDLTKIGTSLNDGMSSPKDWFSIPEQDKDVRLSPAQMERAKEEVEMGVATVEEVLAKVPSIVPDQEREIRSWGGVQEEVKEPKGKESNGGKLFAE